MARNKATARKKKEPKTKTRRQAKKTTTKSIKKAPAKAPKNSKTKRTRKDKQKLQKKQKAKNPPVEGSLDLALLCDCTGSMDSWMTRAKETLGSIINNVLAAHEGLHIRVSFVGYRDFSDGDIQYAVKEFTTDVDEVRQFINAQPAQGGGDTAEDVVGGYKKMYELDWQAETRIAFHICDAPAHGRQYHNDNNTYDDYPKGSPYGISLEEIMNKLTSMQINLTFIKLTNLTDKMFEVMSEAYNQCGTMKLELTDMDQSKLKGMTKEEIDKAFIDKASFIISKKVGGGMETTPMDPLWDGDIAEGEWYSSTNYIRVLSVSAKKVEVSSTTGGTWSMSPDLIQKMDSADHFEFEIPMARGELVEMLESTRDTIFTICFRKKVQPKNVSEILKNEALGVIGDLKKSKKLTKKLLEGDECVITGKMINLEPKLGRSLIEDLTRPKGSNLRQVDHRTIEWLIFKNRRFILKKSGKKYPPVPEEALKIEDPKLTRWDLSKLAVGNWFSDTKYLKVENQQSESVIEAVTADGHNLVISADIVKNEMYSATHFGEERKVTRTELAGVIEDAGNMVFSVNFRGKTNEKKMAEMVKELDPEILNNKRKLNKYVKEMLEGKETQMTAHLARSEPKLGRSLVIGLDVRGPSKFRQVDHRGIESIVYNNVRYHLK